LRCLASIFAGTFPLFLVFGIAAVFGANTVIFNGKRVYGLIALLDAVLLNIVYAVVFAVLQKFGFLILDVIQRRRT
jgi:cell shape-determining protein MreD